VTTDWIDTVFDKADDICWIIGDAFQHVARETWLAFTFWPAMGMIGLWRDLKHRRRCSRRARVQREAAERAERERIDHARREQARRYQAEQKAKHESGELERERQAERKKWARAAEANVIEIRLKELRQRWGRDDDDINQSYASSAGMIEYHTQLSRDGARRSRDYDKRMEHVNHWKDVCTRLQKERDLRRAARNATKADEIEEKRSGALRRSNSWNQIALEHNAALDAVRLRKEYLDVLKDAEHAEAYARGYLVTGAFPSDWMEKRIIRNGDDLPIAALYDGISTAAKRELQRFVASETRRVESKQDDPVAAAGFYHAGDRFVRTERKPAPVPGRTWVRRVEGWELL
jgi:hypothetical protein